MKQIKKTKFITPIEYAKLYGCEPTYIQRVLKKKPAKRDLPHIKTVKRYSRFWLLEVPENIELLPFN